MTSNEYHAVRFTRTSEGYATRDGKHRIVRQAFRRHDSAGTIGWANAGYMVFWHVYRGDQCVATFLGTLREARAEVACDIGQCPDAHLCRHGIDN